MEPRTIDFISMRDKVCADQLKSNLLSASSPAIKEELIFIPVLLDVLSCLQVGSGHVFSTFHAFPGCRYLYTTVGNKVWEKAARSTRTGFVRKIAVFLEMAYIFGIILFLQLVRYLEKTS